MELTYKTKKLKRSLTEDTTLLKTYGKYAKKIKQRLTQLRSAENLSVIGKLPKLRLHPLKGDKLGEWSIDIQENWRIFFEIAQDPIPLKTDGGVELEKVTDIRINSITDPH